MSEDAAERYEGTKNKGDIGIDQPPPPPPEPIYDRTESADETEMVKAAGPRERGEEE
jgi:hypothetical protein